VLEKPKQTATVLAHRTWIAENGHMHYHVWIQNETVEILKFLGLNVLVVLEQLLEREDSFSSCTICSGPVWSSRRNFAP
jgi:hypothetical protein